MIGSTRRVRVWAYPAPIDLRKSFTGLYGLVVEHLRHDPLVGDLYVFVGRGRTSCKVLLWDGTGLCIYQKRLETGRFAAVWHRSDGGAVQLTSSELGLFLEGCSEVGRRPLSPPEVAV